MYNTYDKGQTKGDFYMAIDGSRSSFPDEVDVFLELFDLPQNKLADAQRLTKLKSQAVLNNDEQNELAGLTAGLKEFMITPETWNKFQDALVAVQEFFYENVQGFIEDKQVIWDSYIRQFHYVGTWNANTDYRFQNMVTDSKGDLFICKRDHRSNTTNSPTNSTNWQRASAKGDTGAIGLNAFYKGDWKNTTAYAQGDAVAFGRIDWHSPITYIAKRANTGKSPDVSPDDWFVYQQLYVGKSLPSGAGVGIHFIQEV